MKGIYIDNTDVVITPQYVGVKKKINGQIVAFENLGIDIDYVCPKNNEITINNKSLGIYMKNWRGKVLKGSIFYRYLELGLINPKKYNFAYIRFNVGDYSLFRLIKYLYENGIKVFLEVPTYPYEDEFEKSIRNYIILKLDKLLWKRVNKYIYRVVLTNDIDKFNNIPVINIINAVNLEEIKIKQKDLDDNSINLIGVANINKWHGYDRVIKGLRNYYKEDRKREINFYVVGDGNEVPNLISLVKEYRLQNHVFFKGIKQGKELEKIFNKCNIGVSSLALFRAGGGHDPIKSREYVAKGLPVIIGYNDRALPDKLKFVLKVEEDNSDICIEELIRWYDNLDITKEEIRKFADNNLSWEIQMNKIIQSIN